MPNNAVAGAMATIWPAFGQHVTWVVVFSARPCYDACCYQRYIGNPRFQEGTRFEAGA